MAAIRLQRGLSQATVARRASVDPSYLSRLENGKMHPTVRTAARVAAALRVSPGELLDGSLPEQKGKPCPVTVGGDCLLDLIATGSELRNAHGIESYTPRQLCLFRRFGAMLQQSSPRLLTALEGLVAEMLERGTVSQP